MRGDHQREQMPLGAYRNRLLPYTRQTLVGSTAPLHGGETFSPAVPGISEKTVTDCNGKVAELRERSFRCMHVRFLVCA